MAAVVAVVAVAALKAVAVREAVPAAAAVVGQDKATRAGGPAQRGIRQAVVAATRPLTVEVVLAVALVARSSTWGLGAK